MRKGRQPSNFALCGLTVILLLVSPGVFAYLDPTTGSMVISAIVGILASIALALKTYWYKVKGFFKRGQKQGRTQQETELQNSGGPDSRKQDSPE
jgi:O-antigen/teichoic acid export membrane protein